MVCRRRKTTRRQIYYLTRERCWMRCWGCSLLPSGISYMCSCLSEETIFGNCNGRGSDGQIRWLTVSSRCSLSFSFPCCSTPSWLNFQSLRSLFPCCKRKPALSFQLYLSIKYTALLSFCFSCVSFFSVLFYHLPTRPRSFLSLPSLLSTSPDTLLL